MKKVIIITGVALEVLVLVYVFTARGNVSGSGDIVHLQNQTVMNVDGQPRTYPAGTYTMTPEGLVRLSWVDQYGLILVPIPVALMLLSLFVYGRFRHIGASGLIAVLLLALLANSCSPKPPAANAENANKSTESAGPLPNVSKNAARPTFTIAAAWRPKNAVITTQSFPGSPGMKYTVSAKSGLKLIALELVLNQDDQAKPISANYSNVTLIDSSGNRHKSLFSYPSAATKYSPNGDSVSFSDDPNQLIGGKLSELGGKLILIFEAATSDEVFDLAIGDETPVRVDVKRK